MKRIALIFLVIMTTLTLTVSGQDQKRVNVNFADTLNNVLTMGFQYLYPQFTRGIVHFNDNARSTAFLNYNILLNEIHFMELAAIQGRNFESEQDYIQYAQSLDMTDVKYVVIGENYFVNTRSGVMYQVANYDAQLLRKDLIKLSGRSNIGAYGMQSQTSSIETRTGTPSDRARTGDEFKQQVISEYSRTTEFYLMHKGTVRRANARGFERVFRDRRDEIRAFARENDIKYQNEQDLVKLLEFALNINSDN